MKFKDLKIGEEFTLPGRDAIYTRGDYTFPEGTPSNARAYNEDGRDYWTTYHYIDSEQEVIKL